MDTDTTSSAKSMRKIIQIAFEPYGKEGTTKSTLHALCDDGTIWYLHQTNHWDKPTEYRWDRCDAIPEIPQDD